MRNAESIPKNREVVELGKMVLLAHDDIIEATVVLDGLWSFDLRDVISNAENFLGCQRLGYPLYKKRFEFTSIHLDYAHRIAVVTILLESIGKWMDGTPTTENTDLIIDSEVFHWNVCDYCGRVTIHQQDEICLKCGSKNPPNNQ